MTTLTLGREMDAEASRSAEDFMAQMHVEKADHETIGGRIKKFFSRR